MLLLTPLLPLFYIQSFLLLLLLILSREQGKKHRPGLSAHRAMSNPPLRSAFHLLFLLCQSLSIAVPYITPASLPPSPTSKLHFQS